jgi:serine/threonine protein kinase
MVAVKRLIGVEIPVNKFRMEAEHFKSLDHKNIVKVVSYCHDESRKERLVEFKGQEKLVVFDGHEQLLCYEYMLNGSLHDYLVGMITITHNLWYWTTDFCVKGSTNLLLSLFLIIRRFGTL